MNGLASVAVIVPAAGESAVIERVIHTLAAQDYTGPLAIVIAANGVLDETAGRACEVIARLEQPPEARRRWRVVSLPEPSKTRALNEGEVEARRELTRMGCHDTDVVLYLDADIELSSNAITAMVTALAAPDARIAQPSRCAAADGGILARISGRALCALPWVADDVVCGGVLAVNRAGRARWDVFPAIAADDAFIINRFVASERVVVGSAWATHPMPSTWRGLARQQRRWRSARLELERSGLSSAFPCDSKPKWPLARRLRAIATSPRVLCAVVFLRIIRFASALEREPFTSDVWSVERDTSSTKDSIA